MGVPKLKIGLGGEEWKGWGTQMPSWDRLGASVCLGTREKAHPFVGKKEGGGAGYLQSASVRGHTVAVQLLLHGVAGNAVAAAVVVPE